MICEHCGRHLPDGAVFCSNCGCILKEGHGDCKQEVPKVQQSASEQPDFDSYDILNGSAVVSLVTGIVGFFALPVVCGIVALVSGKRALWENRRNPLAKAGRTLGTIVLIFGIIGLMVEFFVGASIWSYFIL